MRQHHPNNKPRKFATLRNTTRSTPLEISITD